MATTSVPRIDTDNWIVRSARWGYAAKGVVYLLVGVLATMAAFNLGGNAGGKTDALRSLADEPLGQVLLGVIALALLGYVVWRFVQAFRDTERKGSDAKGSATRFGYAASAVLYLALAVYAGSLAIGTQSGGGGGNTRQGLVATLLESGLGTLVVALAALGLLVKGIEQLRKGFGDKVMDDLDTAAIPAAQRKAIERTGQVGYVARGVTLLIIAYFFARAVLERDASEAKGTEGAFAFLQNNFGAVLMGIVAIGLIAYGVFMFVMARYRRVQVR